MKYKEKWLIIVVVIVCIYVYGFYLRIENIWDLEKCPACYGFSLPICDQLRDDSQFTFDFYSKWKIFILFNVKNVFYGTINGAQKIVLKKLAHTWELDEFDWHVCQSAKQDRSCDVAKGLSTILSVANGSIRTVIKNSILLFEQKEAIICGHTEVVNLLYNNFKTRFHTESNSITDSYFITLLAVNSEPLTIMALSSTALNWFPKIYGSCGRLIVQEYIGPTLTELSQAPWIQRASYAQQLIIMAQQFSEAEIRFYVTDVSMDNFAVNSAGEVKMIDVENVVMVDSQMKSLVDEEHVSDRFGCSDCLSFSYEDLCSHESADHNYFAICKGMLSAHSFSVDLPSGLLHSPPQWILRHHPKLLPLVEQCADLLQTSEFSRKEIASQILRELTTVLLVKPL